MAKILLYFLIILLWCQSEGSKVKRENGKNPPQEPPSREPPCQSAIYCFGNILTTMQESKFFNDSKTFVDMKMKHTYEKILENFAELKSANGSQTPDKKTLKKFLDDNFEPPGQEFEDWRPLDWVKRPKFIENIKDIVYRKWCLTLHRIWRELGRQLKPDVKENAKQYSLLWVPNPFIVPGGRFRETYYWDSYWIIKGLLLSEMQGTARGMLENFIYLIKTYGFVPNGGRLYYLKRSQPPLLIPMVKLYLNATNNTKFIIDNIETLETEFRHWMQTTAETVSKNGKNYTLYVYREFSKGPRPESYIEDTQIANKEFKGEENRESFMSELKAAAMSGWDFSSRWFISASGENTGGLKDIHTRSIVPVDLNAILHLNAKTLSEFYDLQNNTDKSAYFSQVAAKIMDAVEAVLWHKDIGVWLDYNMMHNKRRNYFYVSNIAPLWTGCYRPENREKIAKSVLKYLEDTKVFKDGGVPTSLVKTKQQWDFPNAWPPLQHIMIEALDSTEYKDAQKMAFKLADKWVQANYKGYNQTGHMFEKYDAREPGHYGSGGEYTIQKGFGWTNAVIMVLVNKYSDKLVSWENQHSTITDGDCKLKPMKKMVFIFAFFLIFINLVVFRQNVL